GREWPVAIDRGRLDHVCLGTDPACLGPFDLAGKITDREVAVATVEGPGHRREDRHLRFHDSRSVRAARPWPEMAQLAKRGGVERCGGDAGLTQRGEPGAHLG